MRRKTILPSISPNQLKQEKSEYTKYAKRSILQYRTLENRRDSAREHLFLVARQNNLLHLNSHINKQTARESLIDPNLKSVDFIQDIKHNNAKPKDTKKSDEKKLRLLNILDRFCKRYKRENALGSSKKQENIQKRGASMHRKKHLYLPRFKKGEQPRVSESTMVPCAKRYDTKHSQRIFNWVHPISQDNLHQKSFIEKPTMKLRLEEEPDLSSKIQTSTFQPQIVEFPINLPEPLPRAPPDLNEERKEGPRLNRELLQELLRPQSIISNINIPNVIGARVTY